MRACSHHLCRIPNCYRLAWDIPSYNGPRANHGTLPNGDAVQDNDSVSKPRIVSDDDRALTGEWLIYNALPHLKTVIVGVECAVTRHLNVRAELDVPNMRRHLAVRLYRDSRSDSDGTTLSSLDSDTIVETNVIAKYYCVARSGISPAVNMNPVTDVYSRASGKARVVYSSRGRGIAQFRESSQWSLAVERWPTDAGQAHCHPLKRGKVRDT